MNRPSQRTIGKAMLAIGLLSVGAGITVVVVAQTLIDQVETSVDSSLALTTEALDLVVDSLLATSTIADTVQSGVRSTSSSLQILTESADQTAACARAQRRLPGPLTSGCT